MEDAAARVEVRRRGERLRERIGAGALKPLRCVGEAGAGAITLQDASDLPFQTDDELHREGFLRRALVLWAARMAPSEVLASLPGARLAVPTQGASPTSSRTPRKLKTRRILPTCAVSLPRSISEIQFCVMPSARASWVCVKPRCRRAVATIRPISAADCAHM